MIPAATWGSTAAATSAEYRGSLGRFNYYLSGDYLHNNIGITPATRDHPIHDDTSQGHGFAYLEYLLDSTSKVSAILGTFVGHFQIPNSKDASPVFTVNGIDTFDSAKAKETQLEQNYYAVLSYLKAESDLAYQIALFARYTDLHFHPDPLADLLFNGIAQDFHRSSIATGLQVDGSYVLTPTHTVRAGLLVRAHAAGGRQARALVISTARDAHSPLTTILRGLADSCLTSWTRSTPWWRPLPRRTPGIARKARCPPGSASS